METMTKPRMIGSVNCYVLSRATAGRKTFTYDGTTLGLVKAAVRAGVKVGEKIKTDETLYRLAAAPHDDRAGGFWADRMWK